MEIIRPYAFVHSVKSISRRYGLHNLTGTAQHAASSHHESSPACRVKVQLLQPHPPYSPTAAFVTGTPRLSPCKLNVLVVGSGNSATFMCLRWHITCVLHLKTHHGGRRHGGHG